MSLTRSKQVTATTRAAADHLPEFDEGFDGLCKDQVDNFGHIDTGIEHVYRDSDLNIVMLPLAFEVIDQLLGARIVVVDYRAEAAAVLGIHLVE